MFDIMMKMKYNNIVNGINYFRKRGNHIMEKKSFWEELGEALAFYGKSLQD